MRGIRRLAWGCLLTGVPGILVAYGIGLVGNDTPWPAILMAVAMPIATLGVTLLGVGARAHRASVAVITVTHVFVAVAFIAALPTGMPWMRGTWAGLPRATVMVAVGAGVLPLLVLPAVYAIGFSRAQLSETALARVREAARRS